MTNKYIARLILIIIDHVIWTVNRREKGRQTYLFASRIAYDSIMFRSWCAEMYL